MTTIHLVPGATVITGSQHLGLERVQRSADGVMGLLRRIGTALGEWHVARVEAHQQAMMVELAAHDPRVLAELRAALDRQAR